MLPSRHVISGRILSPVRAFISDSRSVGITLIICTIVSLVVSNSIWSGSYLAFWNRELVIPSSSLHLPHTVLHIVNDGLMAVFFFLAGLEIKRELLKGELASLKKSLLPVTAAIGGMAVPALLYYLWCGNTPFSRGWGIPMATDIAFSLGVLSLLGRKAPASLRIFLTALAIIDDLGGILTIAIFYAGEINTYYLLGAGILLMMLMLLNFLNLKSFYVYLPMGIILWYFIFNSGVHATIAGVLFAFTMPLRIIEKAEHLLHRPVNFIILPVFALANTAIALPETFSSVFTSVITYGILFGLVIGKPIGIGMFSYLAVKCKIGLLPADVNWKQFIGMGMIAGIGFTISIFMSALAFTDHDAQTIAKTSIIIASLLAAVIGFLYLNLISGTQSRR